MSTIKLLANDNEKPFEVTRELAEMSETIKNMLNDLGDQIDSSIPLPNISSSILKKVIAYCQHYINYVEKVDDKELTNDINPWDQVCYKLFYLYFSYLCHSSTLLSVLK